ncbi:MAG: hypothetical protein N2559_06460 [Anaerolineae bacterium]|nr:hypothetical protein [Anaerolineae bacterium]
MRYIFGMLMLLIGIVAGLAFPDIDLRWDFLGHRSIVTHSFLVPLLLFGVAYQQKHITTRLLAAGFSLSLAIHLSFDLFPRAWAGYALIYIPGYGRTNPEFSQIWTAVNIVICMYLALVLVNSIFELIGVIVGALATFSLHAVQTSIFVPALLTLIAATSVALLLPANSGTKQVVQRQKWET